MGTDTNTINTLAEGTGVLDELVDAFAELLKVGEELSVPERELEEEADGELVTEWVLDGDSEGELDGLRETVGLCEAGTEETVCLEFLRAKRRSWECSKEKQRSWEYLKQKLRSWKFVRASLKNWGRQLGFARAKRRSWNFETAS